MPATRSSRVRVLAAAALLCLAGCWGRAPRLTAFRDASIELPAAKTGLKTGAKGAPTGELCIVNVRRDGSVWTSARRSCAAADLQPAFAKAHARNASVIVRADKAARWKDVRPVIRSVKKASVPKLWFSVEDLNEAFLDYEFPVWPEGSVLMTEIWVRIKAAHVKGKGPAPELFVDQSLMRDWEHLHSILRRYASSPEATKDPVVLAPDDDALFGWVIRALDCLRSFGFRRIEFPNVSIESVPIPTEEIDETLDVPIEDIPIEPEAPTHK